MKHARIVCDVRAIPIYTCEACGAQKNGSTVRLSYDGNSTQDVARLIEGAQLRAHDMPVGWSSHWGKTGTIFKCDAGHK